MPNWTPEQAAAIETTQCDLLVSASAGAGKTAVLVERVIRLALNPDAPCGLDKFLVVTFTEAAAAEMREKIAHALRERLQASPDDDRIRRQLLLLDHAQISTIHAFCNRVLRQYFHRAEVDPEFAILNEEEAVLLRTETADALLKKEFDRSERASYPIFVEWMESFAGANPAVLARQQMLRLHAFLTSLDDPDGWMDAVRAAYPLKEDGTGRELSFSEHFWFAEWKNSVLPLLRTLEAGLSKASEAAIRIDPKLLPWVNAFLSVVAQSRLSAEANRWEEALRYLHEFTPGRMTSATKDSHPDRPALKEKLDELRDDVFRKQLLGGVAALLPSQACAVHAASAPSVHLLLDLMDQFEENYQAAKKQRCALDFQDLEQRCLRLLRGPDGGPSEIALLYQEQFDYVLVDEYQDVNHAQDAILALVSRRADAARPRNLFMVGDVKQSIYAFRQAAPEIFLEKYFGFPSVSNSDGSTARINLSRNFRSRPEILQTVNRLFEAMMTKASAGLDYDADAALVAGGDFSPEGAGRVELHVLEKSGDATNGEEKEDEDSLVDWRVAEREAFLVGRKILEMSSTFAFKDVVVLLRSMQGWADAFVSIFHRLGIPAFTDYGTGLLAAQEVRDILHFLTLLDNPLQDVSLAAVLRSPLEGWTETELVQVRQGQPTKFFHEAFYAAAETNPKAAEFINRIELWRTRARRQSLADLLSDIYAETDYPTLVLGLSDGERRRANLLRLQEIAGRFDHFSRRGLARFLRFVEQLREQEGDYGAASPFFEGMDAVRVMTVHKSKGLEFPVVFFPGMGKGFNLMDLREPLLFDRAGGLGGLVEDAPRRLRYPSPGHVALTRRKKREAYAEELRVLYVALTRPKQRLILTGSVDKLEKFMQSANETAKRTPLSASDILAARNRLGWIVPAALANSALDIQTHDWAEIAQWKMDEVAPMVEVATGESVAAPPDLDAVMNKLLWNYPHQALAHSPARISMREYKSRLAAETEEGESVRAFGKSASTFTFEKETRTVGKISAAERGALTHFALRHFDLLREMDYAGISVQIDGLIERGMMNETQRSALDIASLDAFFKTPLARRMLSVPPDRIWREVPFLIGLSPSEALLDDLQNYDDSERIRAQGVIDCLFEEADGGLVLLDYKTDAIKTPEQVAERTQMHLPQMRVYARAVEAVFGQPPKEMYLCFLNAGSVVRVEG